MRMEIAILGGGLTGLAIAHALAAAKADFRLFEARDRPGGRALSPDGHDLGPAWIWPGQPLVAELAAEYGLTVFPQYATGRMVFEDERGGVRRDIDMAMMAGALRIAGGVGALATAMAARLPPERITLDAAATHLTLTDRRVRIGFSDGRTVDAARVILALPPRLAATRLTFTPAADLAPWRATPTWMAGHAKVLAIYPAPFWRAAGLSGDAVSRRGPLAEIHDASPHAGGAGALFGFVGVPTALRADPSLDLAGAATGQLARLFGPEAATPDRIFVQDWAREPFTAVEADQAPPAGHPAYGPLPPAPAPWRDHLILAAAETAPVNGGLIEGALEAAGDAMRALDAAAAPLA